MEKEYVVPQAMLMAAAVAYNATTAAHGYKYVIDRMVIEPTLLAAIQWLAENPIVPTEEQAARLHTEYHSERRLWEKEHFAIWMVGQWQRRMFLQPETPEQRQKREVEAIITSHRLMIDECTTSRVLMDEAYRAGVAAGREKTEG